MELSFYPFRYNVKSPAMWFIVDPEAPRETRRFAVIPTGSYVCSPDTEKYIGTFQVENETLVFHVFEVDPLPTPSTRR